MNGNGWSIVNFFSQLRKFFYDDNDVDDDNMKNRKRELIRRISSHQIFFQIEQKNNIHR